MAVLLYQNLSVAPTPVGHTLVIEPVEGNPIKLMTVSSPMTPSVMMRRGTFELPLTPAMITAFFVTSPTTVNISTLPATFKQVKESGWLNSSFHLQITTGCAAEASRVILAARIEPSSLT